MGKGRAPCCEKVGLKKGSWTPAEDTRLMAYIQRYGHGNWRALPKLAGLLRCGKSCRLRWINYLRPDIKRGNFTKEEEDTIIELHRLLGNKWSKIAARLPGRTDNEIKNVWNTHLKKRLQPPSRDGNSPSPEKPEEAPGSPSSNSSTKGHPNKESANTGSTEGEGSSISYSTTTAHVREYSSSAALIEIPPMPDMDIMWAMLDDSEGSSSPSPGCYSISNSGGTGTWGDTHLSPKRAPTAPAKEHESSSSSTSSSTNSDITCYSAPRKQEPDAAAVQACLIDSNEPYCSMGVDPLNDVPVDLQVMDMLEGEDECLLFPTSTGLECNKWIEYLEKELDLGGEHQSPELCSAVEPLQASLSPWEQADGGLLPNVEDIDLVTTYFDNCASA